MRQKLESSFGNSELFNFSWLTETNGGMDSGGSEVKTLPANAGDTEDVVQSRAWEDILEEEIATHSSILAWKIPVDRGAWRAIAHGVTKALDLTERKHTHTHTHTHTETF